jgi:hypothetical protein
VHMPRRTLTGLAAIPVALTLLLSVPSPAAGKEDKDPPRTIGAGTVSDIIERTSAPLDPVEESRSAAGPPITITGDFLPVPDHGRDTRPDCEGEAELEADDRTTGGERNVEDGLIDRRCLPPQGRGYDQIDNAPEEKERGRANLGSVLSGSTPGPDPVDLPQSSKKGLNAVNVRLA